MRYPRISLFLLAILLLAAIAQGQAGDWQAVKNLPDGIKLKIKLKHGRTFGHCHFMVATDDALSCDHGGLINHVRVQYSRDNISAVYLVHNVRAIGFGIGAGTGAAIGATARNTAPGTRGIFVVLDAGILGGAGYFLGMVLDPFLHGRAVYRP